MTCTVSGNGANSPLLSFIHILDHNKHISWSGHTKYMNQTLSALSHFQGRHHHFFSVQRVHQGRKTFLADLFEFYSDLIFVLSCLFFSGYPGGIWEFRDEIISILWCQWWDTIYFCKDPTLLFLPIKVLRRHAKHILHVCHSCKVAVEMRYFGQVLRARW